MSWRVGPIGWCMGAAVRRTSVAVGGLPMAVLCACSNGAIITVAPDYGRLEADIRTIYSDVLGTTVDRVVCPRLGEIQVPRSFDCDAYVGARHFSVGVKYKSDANSGATSSALLRPGFL
jgi:hypothetical protein